MTDPSHHSHDDETTLELPARPNAPHVRPRMPSEPEETATDHGPLPNRYEIRTVEKADHLRCHEAPGVVVSVDRRYSFSEIEARKLDGRVILLDGAGAFGPLLDDAKNLYNLDHHQGCLRAFTLASCEQALLLVLKGIELDTGEWTIYANDPDLDTVFAIWVLLNHRRVRELDPEARDAILPLLRLEGAIDANGFEIAEYCGLSQDRLKKERKRLDRLFAIERRAKADGGWETMDAVDYTRGMLLEIDRMVYSPSDFTDYASIELEHGHVAIGDNKVAVICRDGAGIYDVEKRLKKTWGDRLGLIALERATGHFTLRRTAALSGIALEDAYARLNLLDPEVDGRPPEKRWGGSDDIGGSPRPDGTGLTPREIGKILKMTYQSHTLWEKAQRYLVSALWTVILAALAGAVALARPWLVSLGTPAHDAALDLGLAAFLTAAVAAVASRRQSRGWTWLHGWRRPAGWDHLALMPLVLFGAALGGVWLPTEMAYATESLALAMAAILMICLALALWFPGLAHGLVVLESEVQSSGGRWFVSRPALLVACLYAVVTVGAAQFLIAGSSLPLTFPIQPLVLIGAAFLVGLALAMMRERSLSIWPTAAALFLGCVVRWGVGAWLTGG